MTRVIHLREVPPDWRDNPGFVYIGRQGKGLDGYFGNPFRQSTGVKGSTIGQFKKYFYERLALDPGFKARVDDLKGKTLVCFCKPHPCHGDVMVEYLDSTAPSGSPLSDCSGQP